MFRGIIGTTLVLPASLSFALSTAAQATLDAHNTEDASALAAAVVR